jgi:hypothetical protein
MMPGGRGLGTVTGMASRMTEDYIRAVGRLAYLWAWPLVNMHNRLSMMEKLPGPGLLGGIIPAASPGSAAMLHDYVRPEERVVACPNQDMVYGLGVIDGTRGPSVVQVPDFGGRFWVYQGVDQRTDSFIRLGAMYGTEPGLYLLAPESWDGPVPAGITGVFRFGTRIAICIPRVFMDDTDSDRAAIQDVINQVMVYPLEGYTGELQVTDWSAAPVFPAGDAISGKRETRWVDPGAFLAQLPEVMAEVPARPGEEALYEWMGSVLRAADGDARVADLLRAAAMDADLGLVAELCQHLRQHARGNHLLLPGPRRARGPPGRVGLLRAHVPAWRAASSAGFLVADAVQRASFLPPQRAEPLLAWHQEQEPALRRRRVIDPDRLRRLAR